MIVEIERKDVKEKCVPLSKLGIQYDSEDSIVARIKICDLALDKDFHIIIRDDELLVYYHPLKMIYSDEGDNLIEELLNNIE